MTDTCSTGPDWTRGYPLAELRAVGNAFDEHDRGLCLGAFSKVTDRDIAAWRADGRLEQADYYTLALRYSRSRSQLRDFTGEVRANVPADTAVVDRYVYRQGLSTPLYHRLRELAAAGPLLVRGWIEKDAWLMDDCGFDLYAVKVLAGSEFVGYWGVGLEHQPLRAEDRPGIAYLSTLPPGLAGRLAAEVAAADLNFEVHYSTYNVGRSWSAVALRGYGGPADIEKPAEMSKGWKAAHPGWEDRRCEWTEAAGRLPLCTRLVQAWGNAQRVRLMRLGPGGGLSRHADITDREAGTADGKVLRVHIPLATNPGVEFTSWRLDGSQDCRHMAAGHAWYLDTRKPHAAVNADAADRIHLVVDYHATPEWRTLLGAET